MSASHDRDERLDRAIREASSAGLDDDEAWMKRTMTALGDSLESGPRSGPRVPSSALEARRALEALDDDALFASPLPDGAVEGDPDAAHARPELRLVRHDEEPHDGAAHAVTHAHDESHDFLSDLTPIGPAANDARLRTPASRGRAETRVRPLLLWASFSAIAAVAAIAIYFARPAREGMDANANPAQREAPQDPSRTPGPGPKVATTDVAPTTATPAPTTTGRDTSATIALADPPPAPAPWLHPNRPFPRPIATSSSSPEAPKLLPTEVPPRAKSLDDALANSPNQPKAPTIANGNAPDTSLEKPEPMDMNQQVRMRQTAANACVVGLGPGASNVTITFGPSGSVVAVVVTSGPAKGTGAESCIRAAFASAPKCLPSKRGGDTVAVVGQ